MKNILLALALTATPLAVQAQKIGSPPPAPHLRPIMQAVINEARPSVGKEFVRGMILTAATSQGNTSVFMARTTAEFEAAFARSGLTKAQLQKMFVKSFPKRLCRRGAASRQFIDMGGKISFAIRDRRKNVLAGGTISKC